MIRSYVPAAWLCAREGRATALNANAAKTSSTRGVEDFMGAYLTTGDARQEVGGKERLLSENTEDTEGTEKEVASSGQSVVVTRLGIALVTGELPLGRCAG